MKERTKNAIGAISFGLFLAAVVTGLLNHPVPAKDPWHTITDFSEFDEERFKPTNEIYLIGGRRRSADRREIPDRERVRQ